MAYLFDFASLRLLHAAAAIGAHVTKRRNARGLTRSVWGTTPILTIHLKAECDRRLGWESESLVFNSYFITHKFDRNLKRISTVGNRLFGPHFRRLLLAWALLKYDVFHYFQDQGILIPENRMVPLVELEMIKRSGKKLFFYTYGGDCRTRETTLALGKFNLCAECTEPRRHCICVDEVQSNKIELYRKYASALIASGDMTAYVAGHYNMYFWPVDLGRVDLTGGPPLSDSLELKIAHAPNHTMFKGSHYLEKAVQELREEGLKISLLRKSQVSNDKILNLFDECDLVADQFIAGAYGYTALEGLSRGKPVLCFLRDESMMVEPARAPVVNCHPDNLKENLRWLYLNRQKVGQLSQYCRPYIEKYHSIDAVAARLGRMYLATGQFSDAINERILNKVLGLEGRLAKIKCDAISPDLFPPEGYPGNLRQLNIASNDVSEARI